MIKARASVEHGSTLMAVTVVVSVLVVCTVCALEYTSVIAKNVERSNARRQELDIGDGAIEYAFAYWRETCRQKTNLARPGLDFADLPLPTAAMFNNIANFTAQVGPNFDPDNPKTIASFAIQAVDPQYNLVDQTIAPPPSIGMAIGASSVFYKVSADVSVPTRGQALITKLRRIFEKQIVSPWTYAIFYADDLEIQPGPHFDINGAVHSNGNVYTGHSSLNFLGAMSYGGDWTVGFMPADTTHSGETPASPSWPSNQPPTREQGQQPFGLDSLRIFSTADPNPSNDSYRELVEQRNAALTDPFATLLDPASPIKTRYYDQADVKVLVGAGGALTFKDASDITLTNGSSGLAKTLFDTFSNAVSTGDSIQDNREAAQVTLTTLDLGKIYDACKAGGALAGTGFGGVIYVTDTTASVAPVNERRAIRLKNGSQIAPGGLTIVSDDAIYIQGDFNTGATGGTWPDSDAAGASNDPAKPTIPGYTRQPCAVIADAVILLSNNWNDSDSTKDVSQRVATNTTYNTAIISGIVPSGTAGGNYSGGVENFPRFLEDWTGDTLTYYGSMVELFPSKYFTGAWGKSNVYNPPTRNWYFDTNFYTTPPPGTLMLVNYKKGRWWTE